MRPSLTPPRTAPETLNTILFDSIAADTVSGRVPHFIPRNKANTLQANAIADSLASVRLPEIPYGTRQGIEGNKLPPSYIHSTPFALILVSFFLIASFNAGNIIRALSAYRAELWSIRRRPNLFDEEQSAPIHIATILAIMYIIFSGIIVYNLHGVPSCPTFIGAMTAIGLAGAYYVLQLIVYWLVGFTFSSAEGTTRFVGGFVATQAFVGLCLAIPAILLVFCPQWHFALITTSITIYCISRIIFIAKGFRIFYNGFLSLLYFILYLCTVEILPILVICRISTIFMTESL